MNMNDVGRKLGHNFHELPGGSRKRCPGTRTSNRWVGRTGHTPNRSATGEYSPACPVLTDFYDSGGPAEFGKLLSQPQHSHLYPAQPTEFAEVKEKDFAHVGVKASLRNDGLPGDEEQMEYTRCRQGDSTAVMAGLRRLVPKSGPERAHSRARRFPSTPF